MSAPGTADGVFEPVLAELSDRHRDEVLAAFAALEHSPALVHEGQLLALRDATLRAALGALLHQIGRTLVQVGAHHWTSGYHDEITAALTADGWNPLPVLDRAVLVAVLVHSIAIPRSRGTLLGESWSGGEPTPLAVLTGQSRIGRTDIPPALGRLRAAGLVTLVSLRAGAGASAAYVPGPQLARLTPRARRRLEEQLVLAAAPDSPLASAIRARRTLEEHH